MLYARASLAGAGYCRQCRRRPAILPLQLWQGCQVCVKNSAQRLPRVAHFYACMQSTHWATSVVRTGVVGVANVGDSLRRLSSLQHRIYNLLGLSPAVSSAVRSHCLYALSSYSFPLTLSHMYLSFLSPPLIFAPFATPLLLGLG